MRRYTAVAAAVGIAAVAELGGQTPLRPQEIEVPGFGMRLHAGWQLLFRDGCRFAVPATWNTSSEGGEVFAPDGSMVWVYAPRSASGYARKLERGVRQKARVREDTPHRLWLEVSEGSRIQHYVDVFESGLTCSCVLDVRQSLPGGDETATRIVASVGKAPSSWPAELK